MNLIIYHESLHIQLTYCLSVLGARRRNWRRTGALFPCPRVTFTLHFFNFPASGDRRTFSMTTSGRYQAELISSKNAYRRVKSYILYLFMIHHLSTIVVTVPRECLTSSMAMVLLRPSPRLPTPLIPTPLIDSISYRSYTSTRWFSQTRLMRATVDLDALDASKGNRERIVILGSGWAGGLTVQ